MESRLPIIDQNQILDLYKERFDNPDAYVDRPLIIWRSNINDGVELDFDDIISECNKDKEKEEHIYPALRKLYIKYLKDNGIGVSHTINPLVHKVCVVYFDISDLETDHPISFEAYSNLITKEWLKRLNDEIKVPIILHLPFVEFPDAFEGYSRYVFKPDFDEWKEEISEYRIPLFKHLIEFLESSSSEEERFYRWYWYFQRQECNEDSSDSKYPFVGSGCDFPSSWMEGLDKIRRHFILPMAQIPKNYIPPKPTKISEISTVEFRDFLKEGISEDVVEDFRKYLIQHDAEIQGNK